MSGSRGAEFRQFEIGGFEVLAGKGARENDRLTLRIAERDDLWLHAAGYAGSHVVIRNPDPTNPPPRDVIEKAAQLAAWHSKARGSRGKVEVHFCRAADVSKPRGFPPGKVQLKRWDTIKVYPLEPDSVEKT